MRPVGAEVTLTVNSWADGVPSDELEGDFLLTRSGTAYQIREWRPSRPGSKSLGRLVCVKLERDAVQLGDPGVWLWAFASR